MPAGVLPLIMLGLGVGAVITAWVRDWIRPRSFRRLGVAPRFVDGVPRGGWWVAAAATFLGSYFVLAIVVISANAMGMGPPAAAATKVEASAFGVGVNAAAGGLTAVMVIVAALWLAPRAAAWLRFSLSALGRGVLLSPLTFVASGLMSVAVVATLSLFGFTPPDARAHEMLITLRDTRSPLLTGAIILLAVVLAPVTEEFLFRACLQTAFLQATRRPWLAIILTAALFAASHATVVPVFMLPTLFITGVCLGITLERRQNFWACVGMHSGFNALQLAAAMSGLLG